MHEFARDALLDGLPADLHGQRILDLGCGEGLITRALAMRGGSVVGIDTSPRMIGHARAAEEVTPSGARYAMDDGAALATVAAGNVVWVTAGLPLNHVPDLAATIRAVRRVLASGGYLVFTVPHPCSRRRMRGGAVARTSRRAVWWGITSRRDSGARPIPTAPAGPATSTACSLLISLDRSCGPARLLAGPLGWVLMGVFGVWAG
ncbi:class I SAM-dependent methyltransferase [Streptomyces sp. NBC_00882]|uniref:class I SAM-dependent methyltransferase n=1 Tax=Streptomyces sp. NBC_00882 TaxID=2975856 RepID=UPI00386728E7